MHIIANVVTKRYLHIRKILHFIDDLYQRLSLLVLMSHTTSSILL